MKRQVPFLALLLLLPVGCTGIARSEAKTAGVQATDGRMARVEVAAVHPSDARITLGFSGEIEGSRDANLAAPLGGYVEEVDVREGMEVGAGQTLGRIDSSTYAARRDQAQAQADLAHADLDRARTMGDLASRAQVQAVETQVKVAEANLKLAETQLSRSMIRAPFAGVVSNVTVDPGEIAPPSALFCRLVQLDPVKVTISVNDREITSLSPGMPATVSVEARPGSWPGTIKAVSRAADTRTRAFKAEIEVPNPDHAILPGMIAHVLVGADVAEQAFVIPQDAVVTRLEGVGVFLEEGGHARWQPLDLGAIVGDEIVVRGGLKEGDRVVTVGHRELAEGDALLVTRTGSCCTDGRITY
jgi:membrane fusion protein, multidrug efflux system